MVSAEWLAGFFDGEGCVHVMNGGRLRNLTSVTGVSRQTSWIGCTIGNTNLDVLKEIQASFGGRIRKREYKVKLWKTLYTLIWACRQPEALLIAIRPFLKVKHRQADLALEFLSLTRRRGPRQEHYPRNSAEQMELRKKKFERRLEIADEIRALNHRGLARG